MTEPTSNTDEMSTEIKVTSKGRVGVYVTYGLKLFTEKKEEEITVRATGAALTNAVLVAETLKRRVKNLHQVTTLMSIELDSKKEGVKNNVSALEIKLSTKALDKKAPGYQEPLPESEVLSEEQVAEMKAKRQSASSTDEKKGDSKKGKGKKKESKGGKGKGKGGGRKSKGKGKGKKEKGDKKKDEEEK